jgi:hypothetical protein
MPCFTSGTIKDFLHLDAKNGHPLIFEAPNNHSGRLSQIEISNFFGLAIDKGSVTFNYGKDSVNYQLMAEIESILAGGKYVYGQIYIPCKKIAPDIFQVSTRDEVIEISGQSLKVDWLKRGFTRLDIQYQLVKDNDKTEGELRIEFFVE